MSLIDVLFALSTIMPWQPAPTARLTFYGAQGDGYQGMKHSASWHGQTPAGFSECVDLVSYGVAGARALPFGTRLKLTRLHSCLGTPSERDGDSVECVVVDRLGVDNAGRLDGWPKTFEALGEFDEGCLVVEWEVIE